MKYFIDTEFREEPNTIDLISIGIVSEDGRKYYALNKECNLRKVWKDEWLNKNVLLPIYIDKIHGDMRNHVEFSYSAMKGIFKGFGKTKKELAKEILYFCSNGYFDGTGLSYEYAREYDLVGEDRKPKFYGYYADYDWVVFCWIFGRMIDLPKGFPMYCNDLKQMIDEIGLATTINSTFPQTNEHNALADAEWNFKVYKYITKFK